MVTKDARAKARRALAREFNIPSRLLHLKITSMRPLGNGPEEHYLIVA